MKVKALVHQVHLTREEVDTLNRIGRAAAHELDQKYLAYDDIKFSGYKPEYWEYYSEQGSVDVEIHPRENINKVLDDIFAGGNDDGYGPLGEQYKRYPTAFSISVGDIIQLGEAMYLVEGCGFKQVEARSA